MKNITQQKQHLKRVLPYVFVVAGIIGCLAAFALTYDKIQVLKDPAYHPSCNINPILSCGSVMDTRQASLLGVPNTIFGLMGFSALTAFGVALLAGATFRRWLWLSINAGVLGAFGFFVYLFFEGVYRINAICPFCFIIWMIVPPVLWYTTLYSLDEGYLKFRLIPAKARSLLRRQHGDVLIVWYLFIFTLLLTHFWYYWKTIL